MGTRGTAIIIGENMTSFGPEFNGDMGPEGFGNEFLQKLSEVENNVEFIKFNNRFNKYNFGYDKIMSSYQGKFDNKELMTNDDIISVECIMRKITSDWMFIKNITPNNIKLETRTGIITIKKNETIRLYFGKVVKGKNRI